MTAVARPLVAPDWATLANYGAGPYPGFANKQQPSAGKIAEGFDPADYLPAEWLNWVFNNHGQWINYLDAVSVGVNFGDGSDGTATADGSAVSGCSFVGGTYRANRDLCFLNLTLPASAVLHMRGFRLYVSGTLTIGAGAIIDCNGGSNQSGGAGGIIGATGNAGAGGAIGGVGGNGAAVTAALGGAGGAGGAGNGGFASGAAGVLTAPTAAQGAIHISPSMLTGLLFGSTGAIAVNGGSGGGGGGGAGSTSTGGAGGGPGGVVLIAAHLLNVGAGAALQARGDVGNVGAGAGATGSGAGGGGGGGAVILVYGSLISGSIDPATIIDVSGGLGGTGGNAPGSPGSPGNSYIFVANVPGALAPPTPAHVEEGNIVVTGAATVTANFITPFAAAPPNPSGYKFEMTKARTDGIAGDPTVFISAFAVGSMTITVLDDFNGVLSWRAWV